MTRPYRGKISVDIRDSTPDWEPFLAPEAAEDAPSVLMIVWDDVGYGAMDVFGGPIETPTMRRIADLGLRYSNFHTTALCSPTRAQLADRPECHDERDGDDSRVLRGVPWDLLPDSFRERLHPGGAGRTRLQHVLRR